MITPEDIARAKEQAEALMKRSYSLLPNAAHSAGNVQTLLNAGIRCFEKNGKARFSQLLAQHLQDSMRDSPEALKKRVAAIGMAEFGRQFGVDVEGPELVAFRKELEKLEREKEYQNLHALDITVNIGKLADALEPLRHEEELRALTFHMHDEQPAADPAHGRSLHEITPVPETPAPPSAEEADKMERLYSQVIGQIKRRIQVAYIHGTHSPVEFFDESVDLAIRDVENEISHEPLPPYVRKRVGMFRDYVKHEYLGVHSKEEIRAVMRKAIEEVLIPAKKGEAWYDELEAGMPAMARVTDHLRAYAEPVRAKPRFHDPRLVDNLAMRLVTVADSFEERHEVRRYFTARLAPELTRKSPMRPLADKVVRRFFAEMDHTMPSVNFEQASLGHSASSAHSAPWWESQSPALPVIDSDVTGALESYLKEDSGAPAPLPFGTVAFDEWLERHASWIEPASVALLRRCYKDLLEAAVEYGRTSRDTNPPHLLDDCLSVGLHKIQDHCSIQQFAILRDQAGGLRHFIRQEQMHLREPDSVHAAMEEAVHEVLPRFEEMGGSVMTSALRTARDARSGDEDTARAPALAGQAHRPDAQSPQEAGGHAAAPRRGLQGALRYLSLFHPGPAGAGCPHAAPGRSHPDGFL
ncbi:MAG: hypothetical protein WDN72_05000 [Alphaproteobacteria bacterium]